MIILAPCFFGAVTFPLTTLQPGQNPPALVVWRDANAARMQAWCWVASLAGCVAAGTAAAAFVRARLRLPDTVGGALAAEASRVGSDLIQPLSLRVALMDSGASFVGRNVCWN